MEKAKYEQLSPEEIEKFEEENMTEEQREISDERETTFEAGEENERHRLLKMNEDGLIKERMKLKMKRFATQHQISKEVSDLLIKGKLGSYADKGKIFLGYMTESELLRAIDELPVIKSMEICEIPEIFTKQVAGKLVEKFPDVEILICRADILDGEMLNYLDELGLSRSQF